MVEWYLVRHPLCYDNATVGPVGPKGWHLGLGVSEDKEFDHHHEIGPLKKGQWELRLPLLRVFEPTWTSSPSSWDNLGRKDEFDFKGQFNFCESMSQ